MKKIQLLMYVLADISLLYFLLLLLKLGFSSMFQYVFLMLAGLLFAGGRMLEPERWLGLPSGIRYTAIGIVCVGFLLLVGLETLILSDGREKSSQPADYVIVLGCRVQGTTPSLSLKYRLYAAYAYLEAHPDTRVVVTGGQGIGEDVTEAFAMAKMLVSMGISPDRIDLEECSTTTKENLEFAKQYVRPETDSVVIVTTNYHMFRAKRLAKAAGYAHVAGYAADNVWYLVPADYLREALAIVKNVLVGNMPL